MELDLSLSTLKSNEFIAKDYQKKMKEIHETLHEPDHSKGTTWVDWPENYDKKEFQKILKLAKHIEKDSDALLVVGIGGSYLGARSGIELLAKNSKIDIVFAGINLDYTDLSEKLDSLKDKDVTVNIVSKSGTTVEALTTLNIVERFMKNKYKGDYKKRIIFTTDRNKGYLREKANLEGIETLSVPDGMGGRFSVLCAVGLLPFACAGINIKRILEGAYQAYTDLNTDSLENNPAYRYAVYRHLLNKKLGKKIELFATFSSKLTAFENWLQQLFCESEGKEGKGLYVSGLTYSTDLHSVGQFIQQGSPIMAETFLNVTNAAKDNTVLNVPLGSPIKFLEDKNISEINNAAMSGTVKAHSEANVPIAIITIDEINEFNYGYLVYFFELACAASGYLLGVNPFNQPGVEQYKAYMRENLNN